MRLTLCIISCALTSSWRSVENLSHISVLLSAISRKSPQILQKLFFFFFKSLSSISSSSISVYFLDSSNIQYFGNSYLEFEGFDLSAINTITVSFQSGVAQGTILYVDQGPANGDFFFMKLFILDGALQVKNNIVICLLLNSPFISV